MALGVVFSSSKDSTIRVSAERTQMVDIARMAGVSVATVSRALNRETALRASTRERYAQIVDIAKNLHYEVDVRARDLRSKRTRTISVVVPMNDGSSEFSDSEQLNLIGGISDALAEKGHDMLLSRIDMKRTESIAREYDAGRAAGVIVLGQFGDSNFHELNARSVPVVVWGALQDAAKGLYVCRDDVRGGRIATEHLIDLGASRIVFVGDIRSPEIALRHKGFVEAHRAKGLLLAAEQILTGPIVWERFEQDVQTMVSKGQGLDAIFAGSDMIAIHVINHLRRLGMRVPEDVAVVGYGDLPHAEQFSPALTTVRQSMAQAGRTLVQTLMALLDGANPASVYLPAELVVRESSNFHKPD